MGMPDLLKFVCVAIAFSVAVWLVLVPGPVTRRRCANCDHSNFVHDPVTGRCRSRVDAAVHVAHGTADSDFGSEQAVRDTRCRCSDFLGPG